MDEVVLKPNLPEWGVLDCGGREGEGTVHCSPGTLAALGWRVQTGDTLQYAGPANLYHVPCAAFVIPDKYYYY